MNINAPENFPWVLGIIVNGYCFTSWPPKKINYICIIRSKFIVHACTQTPPGLYHNYNWTDMRATRPVTPQLHMYGHGCYVAEMMSDVTLLFNN